VTKEEVYLKKGESPPGTFFKQLYEPSIFGPPKGKEFLLGETIAGRKIWEGCIQKLFTQGTP